MTAKIVNAAAVVLGLTLLAPLPAGAAEFARGDYHDVTARKKLPAAGSKDPLGAAKAYLDTLRFLDRRKTAIEVLVDRPGHRVYRVRHVCRSVEECGDDSVAATREALALIRRGGAWRVVWVGAQFICHKGRGQQDWSRRFCR